MLLRQWGWLLLLVSHGYAYGSGFQLQPLLHGWQLTLDGQKWQLQTQPCKQKKVCIQIPIKSIAVVGSPYVAHLAALDSLDKLIGVGNSRHITNRQVQQYVQQGRIQNIAATGPLAIELLLQLKPSVLMITPQQGLSSHHRQLLASSGIAVITMKDYQAPTPLARLAWLQVTGALLNQVDKARQWIKRSQRRYQKVKAVAAQQSIAKPTVLVGAPYRGVWYISGGQSYLAQFIQDAGGHYLWSQQPGHVSRPLAFSAVLATAIHGDIWLVNHQKWHSRHQMLAADSRFAWFGAMKNQQVYNNNRWLSPQGANGYFEQGVIMPERILQDLTIIFQKTPQPLTFYQRLP